MEVGTIYIVTQGAKLTKVGERLVVRNKEGKIIHDMPFFKVRQIFCFGTVEVTAQTIFQLMYRNIDLVYLTKNGRFKCRLSNLNEKSVISRIAQYKRAYDENFRLEMARKIVIGKLTNYKNWMMFKNRHGVIDAGDEIIAVNESIKLAEIAQNIDELMGIEGNGSRIYFMAFKKGLIQNLHFFERNRRPPRDPVNAMLSFGYTILFHKVLSAIEQAGVDPFMANLHSNQNSRPSLALDLMEEFRHFVVDTVVLKLVNRVQVRESDFIYTADKGVMINEPTIALLVREMQARLGSSFFYPKDGKKLELQEQILRQAYAYREAVNDGAEYYQPVVFNK